VIVEFPLTVDLGDGTIWSLENLDEVTCNLEWVDTDVEREIRVWDRNGRKVRLKVRACKVLLCELADNKA